MQTNRYREEKVIKLKGELAELNSQMAATGFSPQEWVNFNAKALPHLVRAHEKVCDRVKNKLLFGARLGRYTISGSREMKDSLSKNGTLRLIAYTGQNPDGQSGVLR